MLIRGKTLKEVEDYFVNDGSFISLVLIKETEEGAVYRLKYHEERYSRRSYNYEPIEETTWLVVDGNMVRSSHPMKRIAMARIGIVNERKIRKKVIRDQAAYDFDMQVCKDASAAGDIGGWCGIRAFCNVTQTPFAEGREKCAKYGWNRSGMYTYKLIQLLKDEGYIVEDVTGKIREHSKTIKSFEEQGWRETYLIHVSSHFVSSVSGTITDYTYGKKKIIKGAWRISKK
jgi:hypothetical protein